MFWCCSDCSLWIDCKLSCCRILGILETKHMRSHLWCRYWGHAVPFQRKLCPQGSQTSTAVNVIATKQSAAKRFIRDRPQTSESRPMKGVWMRCDKTGRRERKYGRAEEIIWPRHLAQLGNKSHHRARLPRQITQETLSMDICQSNDGYWKRKMPLKHCYLEYLAIFFRTITHSYLHVLYQDQLYQPTEAISLESQPIQRQTLGGSSFCPSLAGTKVFHMKLTWKWFLGDSFWTAHDF